MSSYKFFISQRKSCLILNILMLWRYISLPDPMSSPALLLMIQDTTLRAVPTWWLHLAWPVRFWWHWCQRLLLPGSCCTSDESSRPESGLPLKEPAYKVKDSVGRHSTEVAFALLTPPARVWFLFPQYFFVLGKGVNSLRFSDSPAALLREWIVPKRM